MYLFYFDESGDSGLVGSPTKFFVLSCVIVHQDQWLPTLDKLIEMRRLIRVRHGISTRPEIKASDIRRGRGPLASLRWSLERRMVFYRNLLKYQAGHLRDNTVEIGASHSLLLPWGYSGPKQQGGYDSHATRTMHAAAR